MRIECKSSELKDRIAEEYQKGKRGNMEDRLHVSELERMEVESCPIWGTWLVRDRYEPIPFGKTSTDISTPVYLYNFGWLCDGCGNPNGTTTPECVHIKAVRKEVDES